MKFYKRLPLNPKNPMDRRFAVEANYHIITESDSALQLPRGPVSSRPPSVETRDGDTRYNSDIKELETFIDGQWVIIKTNKQYSLTKQSFMNGDYADTYFGPLAYDVNPAFPQNVFVYIENVPQMSDENFILEQNTTSTPIIITTQLSQITPGNTTVLRVNSVADFNTGYIVTGTNISSSTTVVSTSVTNLTITISNPTTGALPSGTPIYTSIATTGTYIKFVNGTFPVPNKPVVALIGLDGYGPPFLPQ